MATNVNLQDLVNEAIKQLTPTLAEAIAKALASTMTAPQTDDTHTPQTAPKGKGGFRKSKHIDSDFTVTEGEINVCEYSEKSIAIWGDTKDKADLIDYIKRVGTHDKHKANFVTPLSAISSRPVGWTINKTALEANGGLDEFLDSIQGLGFNVVLRDSVKDVFEANKAAREQSKGKGNDNGQQTTDKPQTPTPTTDKTTPTPTPTGKGKGKGADKPSIAPTDEQRKGADKTTAQTPKILPLSAKPTTIKGLCYDNDKSEEGYKKTERDLTKRGAWYFAQGTKGAAIYANIGLDCETQTAIYVCIAKVKGDITASVMPEFKVWEEIATNPYKAMTDGKLKASMALMYAYYDSGCTQEMLNTIYEKAIAA